MLIPTDAPPGFAEALEAGDLAFQDSHLAQAAEAWAKARCAADEYDAGPVWVRCSTLANTRLEILLALDGVPELNICLGPDGCPRSVWCAAHPVWQEAQDRMRQVLSSMTLDQLAAQSRERRAGVPAS